MMFTGFAAVARWRRLILPATLLLAVIMGVLSESDEPASRFPVSLAYFGPALVLLALAVVSTVRYHPAALVSRPEQSAFAVRPNPGQVLLASAFLLQGGLIMADAVHDIARGEPLWGFSAATVGIWVFALIVLWRMAWGWFGVHLRPEGVYDRQPLGSLFVPWDSLVRDYPAAASGAQQVALYLERPDAVRRQGLRLGGLTMPAVCVDATFLARAIGEYARRPEHRDAIGTDAELRRLTAAITD